MSKKKLLVSTQLMEIGGVERSLIGLLGAIDYSRYEVDVFIYNHDGRLLKDLPKQARLLPEQKQYAALFKPLGRCLKRGLWQVVLVKMLARLRTKWGRLRGLDNEEGKVSNLYHTYLMYYAALLLEKIKTPYFYDACLAFLHPNFVETRKIKAKRYLGWVHTDYGILSLDSALEQKMWQHFNTIFAVSDACLESFLSVFPVFKAKAQVLENILNTDFIRSQALENEGAAEMRVSKGALKLLSIGRFSYPKNFDSIPEMALYLQKKGLSFKWFIIGFGEDESLVRQKIKECDVADKVIILGRKINPYPYLNAADVYIQPSRFEGKAVTVREAQAMGKPVIITQYKTADSQLADGLDGVIVPQDTKACVDAIFKVVNNKKLLNTLSENCRLRDYSNGTEIGKLYREIEK